MSSTRGISLVIPVEGGMMRPSLQQQNTMETYLRTREGKAVAVKFSRPTSTRSLSQNSYYWGVILTYIAESTGHTTEEIHVALKQLFLPRQFVKLGSKEIETTKSTTDLDTLEFENYLERVRVWANTELGITIPLPNE